MRRHSLLLSITFILVVAACGDDDGAESVPTPTAAPAPASSAAPTVIPTDPADTAAPVTPPPSASTAAPPVVTAVPVGTAAPGTTAASATAPTTTAAPQSGALFAITSVSLSPAGQDVVIQNIGDVTGNLMGFAICQRPNYHTFGDIELAPGELVAVSLGGDVFLPPPGAKTTTANIGRISADDGEIGLYSTNNFGSSSAIVDYVEWGSSGHPRSSVAIEAGIWAPGHTVETTAETTVIFANSTPTSVSEDWNAG